MRISEETWTIAVRCAASQFESYVRRGETLTPEQRAKAIGDALQHAIGIIQMRGSKVETAEGNIFDTYHPSGD